MNQGFTEDAVEQAALDWLSEIGFAAVHGAHIAPREPDAEREIFGCVVLVQHLRSGIARLNPHLPQDAWGDAFRKATRASICPP
jgi:type I restriction enzyme R subunit